MLFMLYKLTVLGNLEAEQQPSQTTSFENRVYKTGISNVLNSFWSHRRIDRTKIADKIKICKNSPGSPILKRLKR